MCVVGSFTKTMKVVDKQMKFKKSCPKKSAPFPLPSRRPSSFPHSILCSSSHVSLHFVFMFTLKIITAPLWRILTTLIMHLFSGRSSQEKSASFKLENASNVLREENRNFFLRKKCSFTIQTRSCLGNWNKKQAANWPFVMGEGRGWPCKIWMVLERRHRRAGGLPGHAISSSHS